MKTTEKGRAAHTDGEWRWACDSYGKVQHSRKYDCVFTTVKGPSGGDLLVTVAARIPHTADAVLIAAAPELLAALRAAVASERLCFGTVPHVWLAKAEAAIKAAEGGESAT